MSASPIPKVGVIVLNWDSWNESRICLESLSRIDYENFFVILLDNGSSVNRMDELLEAARSAGYEISSSASNVVDMIDASVVDEISSLKPHAGPRTLVALRSECNLGFAGGNNVAIRLALEMFRPDYILLLNNDTVVDKRFLSELVEAATQNRVAICGGKILYQSRPNTIRFAGGRMSLWRASFELRGRDENDVGQFDRIDEVDYIEGSCMLIDSTALDRVGLFDTEYFAYWEDVDLCLRMKREGLPILFVPTAVVWHKVGASTSNKLPMQVYLATRNRILFMRKHAKFVQMMVSVPFLLKYMVDTIVSLTFKRQDLALIKEALVAMASAIVWHVRRERPLNSGYRSVDSTKKR